MRLIRRAQYSPRSDPTLQLDDVVVPFDGVEVVGQLNGSIEEDEEKFFEEGGGVVDERRGGGAGLSEGGDVERIGEGEGFVE